MPYKIETDHMKLPRELDKRVRLTDDDKQEIRELIWQWLGNQEIAVRYWVHRKTIYLIRNPKQALKEKEDYKLRRLDWRYYNKDKHTIAIKETRKHRYENKDLLIK